MLATCCQQVLTFHLPHNIDARLLGAPAGRQRLLLPLPLPVQRRQQVSACPEQQLAGNDGLMVPVPGCVCGFLTQAPWQVPLAETLADCMLCRATGSGTNMLHATSPQVPG